MTIEQAYLSFINSVERNMTNDGFSADKDRFVLIFNSAQIKFMKWIFKKGNTDDRRSIQRFVVNNCRMEKVGTTKNSTNFSIPSDFLHFLNLDAVASNEECGNISMNLWEAKHENTHELLHDEFNAPSFDYRETFYTIGEDEVKVYTDNFDIQECLITYYRYPKKVDMEGYTKEDGTLSSNVDPEFSDDSIEKILDICAKDFAKNEQNFTKYQVENQEIITDF